MTRKSKFAEAFSVSKRVDPKLSNSQSPSPLPHLAVHGSESLKPSKKLATMRPLSRNRHMGGSKTRGFLHIVASQLRYGVSVFAMQLRNKTMGFCIFHFTSAIMLLSVATLVLVLFV